MRNWVVGAVVFMGVLVVAMASENGPIAQPTEPQQPTQPAIVAPPSPDDSGTSAKRVEPVGPTGKLINTESARLADALSARGDGLAMMINLSGELCAKVENVEPTESADKFVVTCQETRSGSSIVRYNFNTKNNRADRRPV